MLEAVKAHINNVADKPFEEFYADYLISVQEISIDLEISYYKLHNKLDILTLDKLICDGLNWSCSYA